MSWIITFPPSAYHPGMDAAYQELEGARAAFRSVLAGRLMNTASQARYAAAQDRLADAESLVRLVGNIITDPFYAVNQPTI